MQSEVNQSCSKFKTNHRSSGQNAAQYLLNLSKINPEPESELILAADSTITLVSSVIFISHL